MAADLLAELRTAVGAAHVLDDEATLAAYASSTASRPVRSLAVVYPSSLDEVVALVGIAARHGVPLYPLSTGRNWGYGDACPVLGGGVTVSLSRMNRILSFDPELAYVSIEPGVTQQQLSDYLRENGDRLWMDSTGAGPDTSLVGNILERGFGHSPYGNRLQNVCGMQLVLANGDVLDTGFGHYPQARAAHVFPYGVGPFIDGVFTQSNFGIVTRLGLWLMPRADTVNHFLCQVERHQDIAPVVDALRPLRLDGTLRSIIHIGNDLRVLSGGTTFPRDLAGDRTPLPHEVRERMRQAAGVGAWTVSGALYGSSRQVSAARHAVRAALRSTPARPVFVTQRKLAMGAVAARVLGDTASGRRLRAQVELGQSLFAMNRGVPNGRFLAGAYWRRRGGLPASFPRAANPALDNCGLLWVSPIVPMRGVEMLEVYGMVEPIFADHRFDLFATFSMITERALGGVITVAYDKDDADETERARRCYRACFDTLMAAGYIPYRVGNQSMADLDPAGDTYWKTVRRIKDALDPQGILAPGRYDPMRAKGGA